MAELETILKKTKEVYRDDFYRNMDHLFGLEREEVLEILEGEVDLSKFDSDLIPEYEQIIKVHMRRLNLKKCMESLGKFTHEPCPIPGCDGEIVEGWVRGGKFRYCSSDHNHMVIFGICSKRAIDEERNTGADPETREIRTQQYIKEYLSVREELHNKREIRIQQELSEYNRKIREGQTV